MNKVLVWNCRGIGASKTLSYLVDMIKCHKPNMVALLKTRVHSNRAMDIVSKTYLTDFAAAEAAGFTGGIWLIWDRLTVTMEIISKNDQALNAIVHMESV